RREGPGRLDLLDVERWRDEHELAEIGRARTKREADALPRTVRIADPCLLAVRAVDDGSVRAERLDGRCGDDTEQLARPVGGDERLAEAGDRFSHPRTLGLELDQALPELRRHVVE